MKTKFKGILTLFMALVVQLAFAQQTYTGQVTDPNGEPALGVLVQIKDTNIGVQTDFDGNYSIQANPGDILVFSSIEFQTQEKILTEESVNNITMQTNLLDAVTVTVISDGIRDIQRKTATVAASILGDENIGNRSSASLASRLQGQIPGVSVQASTGQPGANSFIRLRGQSSISGNSEPLFVIDGIPVNEDEFRTLNPNDVASVTTLRDAAGTAIYGNRGANGVIVIKTKQAKFEQPLTVSYSGQSGFSFITNDDYNRYDAQGYLRLENARGVELGRNIGLGSTLTNAEIDNFESPSNTWVEEFFRTGITNSQNLSFSSGGSNTRVFTSVNFTRQEGVLQNSDLQRFNLRNNFNGKSQNDKLSYGVSTTLGYSKNNTPGAIGTSFIFFNPVWGAFNGLPYLDPADYDPEVLVGDEIFNSPQNAPYVLIDNLRFAGRRIDQFKMVTGANVAYKITPELTAKYELGADYGTTVLLDYEDPRSALSRRRLTLDARIGDGNQVESFTRDFRFNSKASLTYNKTFGDEENRHNVTGAIYTEYIKGHLKSFRQTARGLDPRTFSPGDGSSFIGDTNDDDFLVPTIGSSKNQTGLFSYFATADYNYNERYGFSGTLRRDASSRFTADNKWGTFWSVAGFWNIDEESFMKSLKDSRTIDALKLRVSHGSIGNDRILNGYYDGINLTRSLFTTGTGYNNQQTFIQAQIANPNLRWETITTTNVGVDFQLFERRLRGSIDLYNKKSIDLFTSNPISAVNNGIFAIASNLGDMVNRGIELNTRYDLLKDLGDTDKVNLTLFGNISYNENEVTRLNATNGLVDNTNSVIQEGKPLNEFFLIPYLGVNPANGQALYLDINGNPTENPTNDDRRLTGSNTIPDFQGGFGFSLSYKNFFFENQWSFITGIQRFDFNLADLYDPTSIGNTQLSSDLNRAWTPTNRVTDIPSLEATNLAFTSTSDRFLFDSSFLRLRYLQLGYNFPRKLLDTVSLKNARVYVSGENVLTFSKWRGFDPESSSGSSQTNYPTPSIYSFGIDLTF